MDSKKPEDVSMADLWELQQSRRRDHRQLASRRSRRVHRTPDSVELAIDQLFGRDGESQRRITEAKAVQYWRAIVGDTISQHATAIRVRNKTLIVLVQDPMWMQQLNFLKHSLVQKMNEKFPTIGIKEIFFTRRVSEATA